MPIPPKGSIPGRKPRTRAREGINLSKLEELFAKQGGMMRVGGIGGQILGRSFDGNPPVNRRGFQETRFEIRGTRSKRTSNIGKETPLQAQDVRKVELDLVDESETGLKYCGEMLGTEDQDIVCEVEEQGNVLSISGTEIRLPKPVSEQVNWSYKNGVLEVTLIKMESK